MIDGARLAWRLRSLDPERHQLPVDQGSNHADHNANPELSSGTLEHSCQDAARVLPE
jgi:hypothetical protein